MSPELDKKLCEKYPKIFRDRNGKPTETAMCWGFSHGDGWYELIDELCDKLMRLAAAFNTEPPVASQVKEKFGGLRFYVHGMPESWHDIGYDLVHYAEGASYSTCEECGKHGHKRGDGWIRTLCSTCAVLSGREIEDWENAFVDQSRITAESRKEPQS